eukprot:6601492-Prymnesium_polylepis.2
MRPRGLLVLLLSASVPVARCQDFASQDNSLTPWGAGVGAQPSKQFVTSAFATLLPSWDSYSRLATRRPSLVQVIPRGCDSEGNITVLVIGSGFVDYGDVKCRFGSTAVRGQVLHDRALACMVPPRSALLQEAGGALRLVPPLPAVYHIRVSLNGVDFFGASQFWYFNRTRILVASIRPSG